MRRCATGVIAFAGLILCSTVSSLAQTNCEEGNAPMDFSQPKTMNTAELIQKFAAAESRTKEARTHYTYTQDVLVQTLRGKSVDGEFHEVTAISYDDKGKRLESVTFAEQPSLRGVQLTQDDMQDIRQFMPFMLPAEDLSQYNLKYAGQQRVDELDTYVFHVEPRKEEKGHRYFQGRIWIDARDLQIVKVCGKSVPNPVRVKKNQQQDLRANFVTYRQQVDGLFWFPAYTRSDDTLQFRTGSVHVREVIKYANYKRSTANISAGTSLKPQ
jgi:hypothetical protein